MPTSFEKQVLIDLANAGSYQDVDVSRVNEISVGGIDHERWGGTAVVEVFKLLNGQEIAFGTAATIDSTSNTSRQDLDVSGGINAVRVKVKTPDSSKGHGRLVVVGKETQ